ncbi:hypothetical protein B484DRAFT_452575 [Ochromonadaceae sp. CCMP2298]|nr:hypothetical protein B484DRAFT_452575 [Ochromonadaceae sp. CCMP2298]
MSGRLIILPHKSWNVWNRDNREKVARDERLHREDLEAKLEKEKALQQERNLAVLRAEQEEEGGGGGKGGGGRGGHGSSVETFRLFEDVEHQAGAKLGNPDYLREKKAKEQLREQREGVPDLPLGDGSIERGGVRPWYEKVRLRDGEERNPYSASYSSYVSNESRGAVEREGREGKEGRDREGRDKEGRDKDGGHKESRDDREKRRKGQADPMRVHLDPKAKGGLLAPKPGKRKSKSDPPHAPKERSSSSSRWGSVSSSQVEGMGDSGGGGGGGGSGSGGGSGGSGGSGAGGGGGDAWAALRQKRLAREEAESKRTKRLLASQDVFGSPGRESGGDGYGQQYHPHLAKKNRY